MEPITETNRNLPPLTEPKRIGPGLAASWYRRPTATEPDCLWCGGEMGLHGEALVCKACGWKVTDPCSYTNHPLPDRRTTHV